MPGILRLSKHVLLAAIVAGTVGTLLAAGQASPAGQTAAATQAPGAGQTPPAGPPPAGRGGRGAGGAGGGRGAQPAPPPYEFPPDFTLEPRPEPQPGTADPGVMFTTIMDRPEVRILRVEIQPGAVRRVHTHEDVTFHLLMPLTGPLQVTAGPATVMAKVGQAYFMKKSMPHTFTNTGTTAVLVMETFVKPEPRPAAGRTSPQVETALAMALAASREASR